MSTVETKGGHRITQQELVDLARERFGDDPLLWAFTFPNCGDVASPGDFRAIEVDPQRAGQECIGRWQGALTKAALGTDGQAHAKRGCDWAAYGLFSGPWFIQMPDGRTIPGFPLAPAPAPKTEGTATC